MGNTHNHSMDTKQTLVTTKPTKISTKTLLTPPNKIKPIIYHKSKWRCLALTDLTCINKNRPKMLSTLQLSRLDFYNAGKLGPKILCKSFKHAKNISSLIIDLGDYNTKELSYILNTTNRWKKLKFYFNQAGLNLDEELTKKFIKLRRFQDLKCLDISFDETEDNKVKETIVNNLSQQTRRLPKLKDFALSFNPIEGLVMRIDMDYIPIFDLKYPRSLSSLTLRLNCSDSFIQQLLSQFTSHAQYLHQLEHLSLDFDIISTSLEPQLWTTFFEKTQRLKSLCLQKSFSEDNQQLEASKAFLQAFSQLKNLISLEINFLYLSGETQAQAFTNLLLSYLASFPNFKSLIISLSAPIIMNNHPVAELPYFFSSLQHLTQLEQLHLHFNCNQITTNFLKNLAQSLQSLENLKSLKLCTLNLEPSQQTILFLAESLQKLIHLKTLDLNFPNIDFDYASMEVLSKSITDLPLTSLGLILGRPKPAKTMLQNIGSLWEDTQRLTHFFSALYGFNSLSILSLNLSIFDISIPECKHFALALRELRQIKSLSLTLPEFDSSNNFETLQYLLSSLIDMHMLTSLFLEFTGRGLGGKEIHHLASNLGSCKSLENLDLRFSYGNNFSGEIFHCLLSGIANLSSSLKHLTLSLDGTPKFDRVKAYKLLLQDLTVLRNLETLILHSLFRQYPRYPSQGITRDLKEKLANHPNFKHLVKLEIGNF